MSDFTSFELERVPEKYDRKYERCSDQEVAQTRAL